jgi:hypothetical protein
VVRNSVSYGCSSHTNGRDVFCKQKGTIKREKAESALLSGIKAQLLDPDVVRDMSAEIRRRASAPKRDLKKERLELDTKIQNAVDTLVELGRSDALTARLRDLEAKRDRLAELTESPARLVTGADEKWREIVSNLENLKDYALPDEVHSARELIREIIGEVVVREEPDGTYAYPAINTLSVYICGAQERT